MDLFPFISFMTGLNVPCAVQCYLFGFSVAFNHLIINKLVSYLGVVKL